VDAVEMAELDGVGNFAVASAADRALDVAERV
jgi:hypothetical protein